MKATPIPPSGQPAAAPRPDETPRLTYQKYAALPPHEQWAIRDDWIRNNPANAAPPPPPLLPPLPPQPPPVSLSCICDRCAAVLGVDPNQLRVHGFGSRKPANVDAREIVYAIARASTVDGRRPSLPEIALVVGGRNHGHSTVVTSLYRWSQSFEKLTRAQDVADRAGLPGDMRLALARLHAETAAKYEVVLARRDAADRRERSKAVLSAVGP